MGKTVAIPFGNYFNMVLDFSDKNKDQRFEEALELVESFLLDYNLIVKNLSQIGLGLEIHGQNLLVYIDSTGRLIRKYLYRDFGQCTISDDLYKKSINIDEYYKRNYNFDFQSTNQVASYRVCIWESFRVFILGYLYYNLDRYQKDNKLNFNVYKWGDSIIERCDYIRNIY